MTLDEFQEAVVGFAQDGITLEECVLALTEEAGEVSGKLKRWHRGDYLKEVPLVSPTEARVNLYSDIRAELGDVLWYAIMTAVICEGSLEFVARDMIDKLTDRHARGVVMGSGDKR